MKPLLITRIKPNPTGKDRSRTGSTSASQLAAEWVDFKNTGTSPVDLGGIELYHLAYAPGSTQGRWDNVMGFSGILYARRTVRVHSGSGPESVIRPEDRAGAENHLFTGRDYVWNNRQADSPTLFDTTLKQNVDQASRQPLALAGQVIDGKSKIDISSLSLKRFEDMIQ